MPVRNLLAMTRVREFGEWLSHRGWTIEDPKGDWEVLRATSPTAKKPIVIYGRAGNHFNDKKLVHATIQDGCPSLKLVRRWLREKKDQSSPPKQPTHLGSRGMDEQDQVEPGWGGK